MNIDFNQIYQLVKLLKPKFYNTITKIIVGFSFTLLSKPLWLEIINIFLKEFHFQLIGELDWLIGLILIIITLIYNTANRYYELKYQPKNEPAYKNVSSSKLNSFTDLCVEILPLLKENEYIFLNTGPNSGADGKGDLRLDLTLWDKLKQETISPNNNAIKSLIEKNSDLIPFEYTEIFNKMKLHIEAFDEHLVNPDFDYSNHQFPNQFKDLIIDECIKHSSESKLLTKAYIWLKAKINKIEANEWFVFGSFLLYPQKASDTDIAILLPQYSSKARKDIENLKMEYKIKFKKELHLSIFTSNEQAEFKRFKSANNMIKNG